MKQNALIFTALAALCSLLTGCASVDSDWAAASSANSISSYQAFLRKHSTSEFAQQARERIEDFDFSGAKARLTDASTESFASRYPKSTERIEELRWGQADKRNTPAQYQSYLRHYPSGKFASEAARRREDLLWASAKQRNSVEALSAYIRAYPNGQFVTDAKDRLAVIPKPTPAREPAPRPAQPPNSTILVAKSVAATASAIEADVASGGPFTVNESTSHLQPIAPGRLERTRLVLDSKTKVCVNGKQVANAASFPQDSLMTLVVDSSRDLTLPLLEVHSAPPARYMDLNAGGQLGRANIELASPPCEPTLLETKAPPASAGFLKPGVWAGQAVGVRRFALTIAATENGPRVESISYKFDASLEVGRTAMPDAKPFGAMKGKALTFDFPVVTKFALAFSANINSPGVSGGEIGIEYYRAEVMEMPDRSIRCRITQIRALDRDYADLVFRQMQLAPPESAAKMQKQYVLTLQQ